MRKLFNFLLGSARIRVTGRFPERIINLCAQNRVEFWAVDWHDEHAVSFTLRSRNLSDVRRLAEKMQGEVTLLRHTGLPVFASKFRKRYGFLTGLCLALITAAVLSQFVLTVEVTGNETVSTQTVLQYLRRHGVRPGAFAPGLDRRQIEQEILLECRELSWMTINLHGTKVQVQVRERDEAPKRIDESGFFHIAARADGIVSRVEPELGDALVQEGDIVARGEILISGTVTMEPPQYSDLPERYYHLRARGRVWARTWRELTAAIPAQASVKQLTGRDWSVWSVNFFGKRVEFFGNSSISKAECDRITKVRRFTLPGGDWLPVWLQRDVYREYETAALPVEQNAAQQLLEQALTQRLKHMLGEDGRILNTRFQTRIADGLIYVSMSAECEEEIGQEVPARLGE